MRKSMIRAGIWSLIFVLLIAQASCYGSSKTFQKTESTLDKPEYSKADAPFVKYETPVTLTACRIAPSNMSFLPGEDLENNVWTKFYEEKLNIRIKYVWTAPDWQNYDQKINLAISADDLPDIMPIYTTLFYRIAQSGMAADLTEVFDKYASKPVKDMLNLYDGIAIKSATYNGKLYGIGMPPDRSQYASMLWIRNDWMQKLGLKPPRSLDDVVDTAREFTFRDPDGNGKNDTIGLSIHKNFFDYITTLEGFFNAFHAYPNIWIERNGRLEYGSIQPETKNALVKLNDMYREGLIDKEFGIKGEELVEDYKNGKIGMFYSHGNMPLGYLAGCRTEDPKAEWTPFRIVSSDAEPALSTVVTRVLNFYSAGNRCKNPEALVKLVNLHFEVLSNKELYREELYSKDGVSTMGHGVFIPAVPGYGIETHLKITEALRTGDVSMLNPEQSAYYSRVKAYMNGSKDALDWATWRQYGPDGSMAILRDIYMNELFYPARNWGPETPTWIEKGQILARKQIEYFKRIIMETAPEQEFNNWVKYFNEQGGEKITQEMNAWWKIQQGKE